jgi:CHAT domain-containing protein/Flp pilus assembly protein TadD
MEFNEMARYVREAFREMDKGDPHLSAVEIAELTAGKTSGPTVPRMEQHLATCERCRDQVQQYELFAADCRQEKVDDHDLGAEWRAMQRRIRWHDVVSSAPRWAAIAACTLITAGVALYWQGRTNDPERLLENAYTALRPFEYRLPGGFGGVQSVRGSAGIARPPSLLRAEAEIQSRLIAGSPSSDLLLLKGRAALMERDYSGAIDALLRSSELVPDPPVLVDLGIAYALRAETESRGADYAPALDALLRALRAEPRNPRALFNLAIVYERLSMMDKAVETWNRLLTIEPNGPWADESRRLLIRAEEAKKKRDAALSNIAGDPASFLAKVHSGDRVLEYEYLQNSFWSKWLPEARSQAESRDAAQALADQWIKHFGDYSLKDAYEEATLRDANVLLADVGAVIIDNIHGRNDQVLGRAENLANQLAARGQKVASFRMRLELAYSYRRSTRHEPCLAIVDQLLAELPRERYPWLAGRTRLEHSTCIRRAGSMGVASKERYRIEAETTQRGLKGLALQARELNTHIDSLSGNSASVWNRTPRDLATYWNSAAADAQAQQALWDMSNAARALGYKHAAIAMEADAVEALVRWQNPALEAVNRAYLASLMDEAGDHEGAIAEFDRADRIYGSLPPGPTIHNQIQAARLRRAEAEAAGSAPASAISHLESVSPNFSGLEAQMRLQQARGIALLSLGDWKQADSCFRNAIQLADEHVNSFSQPLSRVAALEMAMDSRRSLVQVALINRGDPAEAFQVWDHRWKPAGEARDSAAPDLGDDVVLTYVVIPTGVAVMVANRSGIRGHRLTGEPTLLRAEAADLHRLCSNPASDLRELRAAGHRLYRRLIGPYETDIKPGARILVQSDDFLALVPFGALVDSDGRYLAERHPISMITALRDRRADGDRLFTRATPAVIVSAGKGAGREFSPLPDAIREAGDLASRLTGAVVLDASTAQPEKIAEKMASAELVHFAGHGWSNGGNAALVLGGDSQGTTLALTATDLANYEWGGCRLAVLSACLTAEGEQRGSVNPQSLVRAFLAAGARRVVAARWSVDGEATRALMSYFYDALFAGAGPSIALDRAMMKIRATHDWEHPYFWAGFDVYGAP